MLHYTLVSGCLLIVAGADFALNVQESVGYNDGVVRKVSHRRCRTEIEMNGAAIATSVLPPLLPVDCIVCPADGGKPGLLIGIAGYSFFHRLSGCICDQKF